MKDFKNLIHNSIFLIQNSRSTRRSAIIIKEQIRGKRFEKFVKRIGDEVALSAGIEVGGFKINVTNFSNIIKELVQIPHIAVTLDGVVSRSNGSNVQQHHNSKQSTFLDFMT
jgi:hypothetical protein